MLRNGNQAFFFFLRARDTGPYLIPQRWGCSTPPVSQYHYHMAASFWSSVRAGRKRINSFGTSCYQIMLKITRIYRVPNATIYSLSKTVSSPYWKSQASAIEVPWSCAPLAWKWAFQTIWNVCSYSWEKETRKTANLVHQLYSLSSGGSWWPTKWQSAVGNNSRLICSRKMMMK